jgi:hypothetical protein
MILGQTPNRTPFTRPAGASPGFMPKLPNTGFYSHFHPLTQVTLPMASTGGWRPDLNPNMGPVPLPPMPAPAPVGPPIPKAGGTAGAFGGSGFGSTGGVRAHGHVDPYMVFRTGMIPGVSPSGANIRAGVMNAGARVNRSMPFQTAALPPLPPPPPAPAPTATGVKGLMGVLSDHLGITPPHFRRMPHYGCYRG